MRPDDMIAKAVVKAADALSKRATRVKVTTLPATYVGTDGEGKGWVLLPGSDSPTPVRRSSVEAEQGDTVSVTVGYGRAVIDSNISNPSAGVVGVTAVKRTANVAKETATQAIDYATNASAAAAEARKRADAAQGSADRAQASADSASASAATASEAAGKAVGDAARANEAAGSAEQAAGEAWQHADEAADAAQEAQAQAGAATTAAKDALVQLATVENVIGTVEWIAEHGTYEPTEDEQVDGSKVYYTRTGSGTQADPYVYTAVPEPTDEGLPTYYELHVDQAVSQYVSMHLALTDAGLYVLADANGYKLLISNTGMSVIDPQGHVVVTYGESIAAASDRPFSIGNEDAYVLFSPATAHAEASLTIGGDNVSFSDKPLSELLGDVEQASQDASEALETALDGAFLAITSTNGQLFKNGAESTILQVVVFPNGGDRCDTIAAVRDRFGSGAYIEWRCKDEGGSWTTLANNDPHLSQGGMWLTVTPTDVDVKTTFAASLVTT